MCCFIFTQSHLFRNALCIKLKRQTLVAFFAFVCLFVLCGILYLIDIWAWLSRNGAVCDTFFTLLCLAVGVCCSVSLHHSLTLSRYSGSLVHFNFLYQKTFDSRVNKLWFYVNYSPFWACTRFRGVWKLSLDNPCVHSAVVPTPKSTPETGLKFLHV